MVVITMKTDVLKYTLENLDNKALGELIKVSTLINSSLNLSEILGYCMDLTDKLLACEASSLLLLDEKTHQLTFRTATGQKAGQMKSFSLKMGQGLAGWAAQKGQTVIAPNVQNDPRHYQGADWKTGFETRSLLCIPMKAKGKLIGVVEAMNKKGGGSFTEEDAALLQLLADQAAIAIQNAQAYEELQEVHENLKKEVGPKFNLIGNSPQMKEILEVARKVAGGDSTLLVRGKSGTGKEMLARLIHNSSPRSRKSFVGVTCSILSQTLLESELFGHEKGAFTGADARKIGRFELAHGGTLFLDEIGTLAPETQLRLLRVLQEKEFERVGGIETIKVDVRIIAATNEDLEKGIEQGKFREDLYYRLKVIEIFMPELKDRPDDIPILARHFLEIYAKEMGRAVKGISSQAMTILKGYAWPGNVRELKNVIERAVVLGTSDEILPEDLPSEIRGGRVSLSPGTSVPLPQGDSLNDAEARHIKEVLEKVRWNKSKASEMLGISRNRLDRKIAAYKLS